MQGIIQVSEVGCCVNRIYLILLISIEWTLTRLIPLCHRSAVPGGCLARCKAQNELKGDIYCAVPCTQLLTTVCDAAWVR